MQQWSGDCHLTRCHLHLPRMLSSRLQVSVYSICSYLCTIAKLRKSR